MADIVAVREWTTVFCGSRNSHVPDQESFFALTTDGREIRISRSLYERLKGFLPATSGHNEVPGGQYGGDFGSMAGVHWSAPMSLKAAILGQLGYSRVSEELVGW